MIICFPGKLVIVADRKANRDPSHVKAGDIEIIQPQHAGTQGCYVGVFAGNGMIYEGAGAFVELDTIIGPLDVYDMDGGGSTTVSVQADTWLTVLADALEPNGQDGFDGNLNVDGTCVITTAAPWRLETVPSRWRTLFRTALALGLAGCLVTAP